MKPAQVITIVSILFFSTSSIVGYASDTTKLKASLIRPAAKVPIILGQSPTYKSEVSIESRLSNFEDPWNFMPASYGNLSAGTSLDIFGLPFFGEAYFTAPNNYLYRGNYVRFSFDNEKFRANMNKKVPKKGVSSSGYRNILDQTKLERLHLKNKIKNLEHIRGNMDKELQDAYKDTLNTPDASVMNSQIASIKKKEAAISRMDSQLDEWKQITDSLERETQRIEGLVQRADSLKSTKFDKQRIPRRWFKHIPNSPNLDVPNLDALSGFQKHMYRMEQFQVGQIAPVLSSLTMEGYLMRGVYSKYSPGRISAEVFGGNAMSDPYNAFNLNFSGRKFDAPVYGGRLGYKFNRSGEVSWTCISFRNANIPPHITNGIQSSRVVNAVAVKNTFFNNVDIGVEVAHAKNTSGTEHSFIDTSQIPGKANHIDYYSQYPIAFNVNTAFRVTPISTLRASLRQINPKYVSPGIPFAPLDIRELDISYEQFYFKRRLSTRINSKLVRDNLIGIKSSTNRIRGFGVVIQTLFDKFPNLFISHQPFQQGNNHPDPIMRMFTQTSLTQVGGTYSRASKGIRSQYAVTFVKSKILLNGFDTGSTLNYAAFLGTANYMFSEKHQVSLTFSRSNNDPLFDSAAITSFNFMTLFTTSEKIKPGVTISYFGSGSNSYYSMLHPNLQYSIKRNLILLLDIGMGKSKQMWGWQKRSLFSTNIKVTYVL